MNKLQSIRRFTEAGICRGEADLIFAIEEGVDKTGHSCYAEGFAAGYKRAFEIAAKFVKDTIEEES